MMKMTLRRNLLLVALAAFALALSGCNDDKTSSTSHKVNYSVVLQQNGEDVIVSGSCNVAKGNEILELVVPVEDSLKMYFIDNIHDLSAEFEVDTGAGIFLNGREQTSGDNKVDLAKEIEYTIRYGNELPKPFRVVLKAPQATGLPIVSVYTADEAPIESKEVYLQSTVSIEHPTKKEYSIVEQSAGIRGRGNSTWKRDKKPYRIKFDKKTSLFGLGAAKSWVLLANHIEPTFIMNSVAFEIGRKFNFEFVNTVNHVELFVNGKYNGSYVLTEQLQVNEHRLNIDENAGFLAELDNYYDGDVKFLTETITMPVNIKSPEANSVEEVEFVRTEINELVNAMFGGPENTLMLEEYRKLIDMPSFVDYILVTEIVRNGIEVYSPKSVYMHKDAGGKITMGPLWDYDWAYGKNGDEYFYYQGTHFKEKDLEITNDWKKGKTGELFFTQFFKDPQFRKAYKDRWNEMKGEMYYVQFYIRELGSSLAKSAEQDNIRWSTKPDYAKQIDKMANWFNKRLQVLDDEINKL